MMLALPERSITTLNHIFHSDALTLLRALASQSVDAIITDMPYGTTACSWDTVIDLAAWWVQVKRVLKPRGVFVTTAAQPFTSALVMSNPKWFRVEWVWDKDNTAGFLNVMYKPLSTHESILVFAGGSYSYFPQMRKGVLRTKGSSGTSGGAYHNAFSVITVSDTYYPKSIIRFSNQHQAIKQHPTQKPVALYEYLIQTYTRPGELVVDPFSGSGTTAVAARKTGRHFICGDSSAEYVAMSRKRLADTDPFMDKQVTPELKQRSMFAAVPGI